MTVEHVDEQPVARRAYFDRRARKSAVAFAGRFRSL
jgi:hypothetical protein